MKAARTVNVNEPLQIQELQTPKPKGSQILIKVQSSGVCHNDVHVWEGYYEGIGGQPLKTTVMVSRQQKFLTSWKSLETTSNPLTWEIKKREWKDCI